MTSVPTRSMEIQSSPSKSTGFESKINQFTTELTNIVISTKESFDNSNEHLDVTVIESGCEAETVQIDGGDVETTERNQEESHCHVFGDDNTNHYTITPFKLEPLILKVESLFGKTTEENQFAVSNEEQVCPKCMAMSDGATHVCVFKCEFCPFTAKMKGVIGIHKRRAHQVTGKNTGFNYRYKVLKTDHKVVKERMKKTQVFKKSTIERNVPVGYQSFTDKTVEKKKDTEKTQLAVSNEGQMCLKCNAMSDGATHVCMFKCEFCPFTAKKKCIIGIHKRRAHQVNGKTTGFNHHDKVLKTDHKVVNECMQETQVFNKSMIQRNVPVGNESFTEKTVEKIKDTEKTQFDVSNEGQMCLKCNAMSDGATHVCMFKCEFCPFTAKKKCIIGVHKRRAHQVRGKTSGFNKERIQKTHLLHKSMLQIYGVQPSHVLVEKQSLQGETIEEIKDSGKTQNMNANKEITIYKCDRCSFTGTLRSSLIEHRKTVHNIQRGRKKKTVYKCDRCSFTGILRSSLIEHRRTVHNIQRERKKKTIYKCDRCSFTGISKSSLIEHRKIVHNIKRGRKKKSDNDGFIAKQKQEESHCHVFGDDNTKLSTSTGTPIKLEPLVIKIEKLFDETSISTKANKFAVSNEGQMCPKCNAMSDGTTHVCVFKCELCHFTAKRRSIIGVHKRYTHKIKGKTIGCNHGSKVLKVGYKVNKERMQKTHLPHKSMLHNYGVQPSHVLVANQSLPGESVKEIKHTEKPQSLNAINEITRPIYKCDRCSFMARLRSSLIEHRRTVHNIKQGRKKKAETSSHSTTPQQMGAAAERKFVSVVGDTNTEPASSSTDCTSVASLRSLPAITAATEHTG